MTSVEEKLRAEYLDVIEYCNNRYEQLTEWETDFLDSISMRLSQGKGLSEKQETVLEKIWSKIEP